MKKNFLNSGNLVIYIVSLALPLLGIVPLGIRHFGINKWCIVGCLCAAVVAVFMMATTIVPGKKKWAVSATIIVTVAMAVLVVVARWVPIPPISFFVCYYIVDIISITISIVVNIVSDYPNKNSSNKNQRGIV